MAQQDDNFADVDTDQSASGAVAGDVRADESQPGQRQPLRVSHGIALCKRGTDGIVRVLMINKRFTYAFFAFVNHKFNMHDDNAIVELFNQMTLDEKLDVLSLNFTQLWYRIWLGQCSSSAFYDANHKFHDHFLIDNGARIRRLMRRSRTLCANRVWEIPKGRKKNMRECGIDCAIREFYEETGIPRSAYHITRGTHELDFTEDGVHYHVTYYIAITLRDARQRIDISSPMQVGEICNMQWVSSAELDVYAPRDIPGYRRIIKFAKHTMRSFVKNVA